MSDMPHRAGEPISMVVLPYFEDINLPTSATRPDALLPTEFGRSLISYARGVRAGQWVFATGVAALNMNTGHVPEFVNPVLPLHGPSGYRVEAGILFDRAQEVLKAGGADFGSVVRTDQFSSDWRALAPFQEERRRRLGTYVPPSTSVLELGSVHARARIDLSLIAFVPGEGRKLELFIPEGLNLPARAGFSPVAAVGDYVFIAGFMAAWKQGDLGGIAPEAQVPTGHLWKGTRIQLETEYLIERKLVPALAAAGASLDGVVKAHIYIRDISDLPAFNETWQRYLGPNSPASVVVPTPTPGFAIEDARIEVNLVAVRGTTQKEIIRSPRFMGIAGQPAAVRAGDFLLISGLLALTPDGLIPGLDDDRAPYFNSRIERQMEAILDTAEDICSRAGTSLKNVVRAQHFMTDLGEFYAAYHVWRSRLGDAPLPFSVIRVPKPLMVERCSVLVDLWIYCPAAAA